MLQRLVRAYRTAELHARLEVIQRHAEHVPGNAIEFTALQQPRRLQGLLTHPVHVFAFGNDARSWKKHVHLQRA
ncbi:hypothetical protein D3C85_950740 [compost metagenome]